MHFLRKNATGLLFLAACVLAQPAVAIGQTWVRLQIDNEFSIYFNDELDVGIIDSDGNRILTPGPLNVGPLIEYADCGSVILTKHHGVTSPVAQTRGIIDPSQEHYFVLIKGSRPQVEGPFTLVELHSNLAFPTGAITWQQANPPASRYLRIGAIVFGVFVLLSMITAMIILRSARKDPVGE